MYHLFIKHIHIKIKRIITLAISSSLVLQACGGGGSSSSPIASSPAPLTTPTPMPTPTPTPTPSPNPLLNVGNGFQQVLGSGINFQFGMITPAGNAGSSGQFLAPEIFAGGAASGDYDNDGDIDIFIVRGDIGQNLLYQNDGTGYFTEVAEQAGLAWTNTEGHNYRHSGPMFVDIDGDTYLDLFLGNLESDPVKLYRNLGDGTFADVSTGSGLETIQSSHTISAAFSDYDRDGDLDMFLTHWGSAFSESHSENTEHLWRNDSIDTTIVFTDVSVDTGIRTAVLSENSALGNNFDTSFTPNFVDINDDLWPDILLTSDFGLSRVILNNGDGTFSNITDERQIIDNSGMGAAIGDFDNDGDFDWFVSAIKGFLWPVGNRLYEYDNANYQDATDNSGLNEETGAYQEQSSWGWGSCTADFNRDENLDIYMTNGYPMSSDTEGQSYDFNIDTTRMYLGYGNNTFLESANRLRLADNTSSRTVVCADFDLDGDTDILQLNRDTENASRYYQNNINRYHYLSVRLRDTASKNTFGVGAKITLTNGGASQVREMRAGSNFTAQNAYEIIFGIQEEETSQLEVRWADGTIQQLNDVVINSRITIEKPVE